MGNTLSSWRENIDDTPYGRSFVGKRYKTLASIAITTLTDRVTQGRVCLGNDECTACLNPSHYQDEIKMIINKVGLCFTVTEISISKGFKSKWDPIIKIKFDEDIDRDVVFERVVPDPDGRWTRYKWAPIDKSKVNSVDPVNMTNNLIQLHTNDVTLRLDQHRFTIQYGHDEQYTGDINDEFLEEI